MREWWVPGGNVSDVVMAMRRMRCNAAADGRRRAAAGSVNEPMIDWATMVLAMNAGGALMAGDGAGAMANNADAVRWRRWQTA